MTGSREDHEDGWLVAPGFAPVADVLRAQLAADPGYSAQLSVRRHGEVVLDLWGGRNLGRGDAITCLFSCSKGVSGVCLALLVQRGLLELDVPVARYWPEFAAAGKQDVTVRQVLTHRAGLPEVDGGLAWAELLDDRRAAVRLAAQRPLWRPGTAWGYHALTLGVLMSELCRRVTGVGLQEFYEREVRAPRGIDLYLGLPEAQESRVAPTPVPELPAGAGRAGQLADLVGGPILGDPGAAHIANSRESHAAGMPAAGGVGSARGLAAVYAHAIGDVDGHRRLLDDDTVAEFGQVNCSGHDVMSGMPQQFGVVFQKPFFGRPFAGYRAFGHDGAGGALGFADPGLDLAFGYVTDWLRTPGTTPADDLAHAVRACVLDAAP